MVETILGAVLDISRLDTGALKPAPTTFRLDALLRQVETDFQPLARERGLELTVVPSSVSVTTDRNLLRRLIQNLVSNAIKYTRQGRVLVGVRRRGSLVEIQVHDTGIGIPGDKLNTVFREFTRLDEGAREAQGLGLGLSIVDRVARVLRLELRLQSQQGVGTCLSVVLPASKVAADPTPEAEAPVGPFSLGGMRVLCVDNDARILESLRLLLEGWGCNVVAIAASSEPDIGPGSLRPDAILADYHLDSETGLEAIARLRDRFGRDIPAVLITADRSAEVREAAARLEVPLLNKPVRPAMLRAALARCRAMAAAE